jgi:hypothetical protein
MTAAQKPQARSQAASGSPLCAQGQMTLMSLLGRVESFPNTEVFAPPSGYLVDRPPQQDLASLLDEALCILGDGNFLVQESSGMQTTSGDRHDTFTTMVSNRGSNLQ